MIDLQTLTKVWALLDAQERRNALIVLGIMVLSALASALMVGGILPFLTVLTEPERIKTVPMLAWAFETFGFKSDYGFLVGLGFVSLSLIAFSAAIQSLKTWAVARFSMMRMHSVSQRLMVAYLGQPYEFFLNRHSGEMSTRILSESHQLIMRFLRPAAEAISATFTIFAILALLLWVEPIAAAGVVAIIGGAYAIIYRLSRRTLKRLGRVRVAANSERFRIINEALAGIKDIKLLGRETSYVARYGKPSRDMASASSTVQVVSQLPRFALEAIIFGGAILFCLVLMTPQDLASGNALNGILPLLGLFAISGQKLMPELQKLYNSLAQLQAGTASVDAVYGDLVEQAGGGALPLITPSRIGLSKLLSLEDISFQYPNVSHAGVRNVTLKIRVGEKIGIVGGTGAGKTTLADIVLGLLAPSAGQLLVDGVPVGTGNLRSWQQSVAYVPQDIFLTDESVIGNVALGVPPEEINQARAIEALRVAQLDKFIKSELPNGYQTMIGERGVRLSGGQRQRIGIARALYHNADLIVFDEATSALDNLTELEVIKAIEGLPHEKTVIMIAHRLSTVRCCDRIVVMERGKIVGCDSWEALMDENVEFQRIAKLS